MACEEQRGKLDLYLDGELLPAEASAFASHLRRCSDCASDALQRVQLKRSVQMAGRRYESGAALRRNVEKMVAGSSRPRFDWRWTWAAAFVLLVVTLGALLASSGRENARRQRVYSELVDLHVATLASATPVEVLSSDRHTVKPWFQGRIPFTFNLPEMQGSQFSLLGGRVAYFEQSPAAHLIFQARQHKISVFILPERSTELPTLPSGPVNELSFNTESWTAEGLRYFIVSDANADDVGALGKLFRETSGTAGLFPTEHNSGS